MSTKPYDRAFKFLAEEDPEALLLLLGDIQPGQPALIELPPREVSVAAKFPDQPYQVTIAGQVHLVHVEAQTVYESDLPDRMLEYAVRLWLKYKVPIASYLLVLTDRNAPARLPSALAVEAGSLGLTLRYAPVCLWQVSAQAALEFERQTLAPFVPLMYGGEELLEVAAQRLGQVADDRKRQEMNLHFLLLGGLRYNRDRLLDLIWRESMIPLEQLKDSTFYQYILEEGREEGRVEGRVEGLEQGMKRGEATLLRRLLEQRFGTVPEWASEKIEAANRDTLEAWALRVANAASLAMLFGPDENGSNP